MSEKQQITTPNGELMYVQITGEGKLDYDGEYREFVASVKLSKDDKKSLDKKVMKFYEENKPSKAGDTPHGKIFRKQEDGTFLVQFKTRAEFDNKPTKVWIKNSKKVEQKLPEDTGIGNGSKGCISGNMVLWTNKKGDQAGVFMALNGVQLLSFIPYVADDGLEEQEGDFENFGTEDFPDAGSSDEKPKKKKKKKKD